MKRTPLKKRSNKQLALAIQRRDILREKFGQPGEWVCSVRGTFLIPLMGPCFGPVNGHELIKRSQGGSIVDPENIIMLCNYHNGWVEDHPLDAEKIGLVKRLVKEDS